MRIVLDTSSLLVVIGRESDYRPIFDAFLTGEIKLLVTTEILNEYVEKLGEKTNPILAENIANLIIKSPDVERIDVHFKWAIITKDADDNKFVDCALNGQADFLVTDDRHFNILKRIGFPPIKIIRTKEFMKEIQKLRNQ